MVTNSEIRIPSAGRLGDGQTLTFPLSFRGQEREAFLLRHDGTFYAYLNECPHWAVELDLGDGHFFDEAIGRIYCKNHGALFHPTNGVCETGPCLGRTLTHFAVRSEGEDVLVDIEQVTF